MIHSCHPRLTNPGLVNWVVVTIWIADYTMGVTPHNLLEKDYSLIGLIIVLPHITPHSVSHSLLGLPHWCPPRTHKPALCLDRGYYLHRMLETQCHEPFEDGSNSTHFWWLGDGLLLGLPRSRQEMMSFWQELLPILIGQSADDVKQRKNGLLDAESDG